MLARSHFPLLAVVIVLHDDGDHDVEPTGARASSARAEPPVVAAGGSASGEVEKAGPPHVALESDDPALTVEQRAAALVARMTLAEKAEQLGHTAPAIPRLRVPRYNWWNEGLQGVARAGVATVFPQAIGMAATWDEALILETAHVIATEFRANYAEHLQDDGGTECALRRLSALVANSPLGNLPDIARPRMCRLSWRRRAVAAFR